MAAHLYVHICSGEAFRGIASLISPIFFLLVMTYDHLIEFKYFLSAGYDHLIEFNLAQKRFG
jgi:hypothetical protein